MTPDPALLYAALDAERHRRDASWRAVASDAGVSPSTLTRIADGRHPSLGGFYALCRWANVSPAAFLPHSGEPSVAVEMALLLSRHGVPHEFRGPLMELVESLAGDA